MKKILIVDDQADIRRLLKITLGSNFKVMEAEDGVSGLKIIEQSKPDLVVMDVMMPGEMDGLKVLELIKSTPDLAGIKVVMLTARGQAADYNDGMKRGADAYFIKPFSPLQLVSLIQEVLAE
jgi:CheY-like chemotaxis protein